MNHVAGNTTLYQGDKKDLSANQYRLFGSVALLIAIFFLLSACASTDQTATPQIQVVEVSQTPALTEAPLTPRPTSTGTPTALPSRTPLPTPREVTVSRLDSAIDPAKVTPIAKGAPLPDLSITDIDGNIIQLTDFAEEGRPLVLNFWTLGCGSCFYEFPLLQAFQDYHGTDKLAVVGVNVADFPEETRIIAQQLGITFPMVVDQGAEFFTTYFNGVVVPTTMFVTADGEVSAVYTGAMDAYNVDQQLQVLGLPPREGL